MTQVISAVGVLADAGADVPACALAAGVGKEPPLIGLTLAAIVALAVGLVAVPAGLAMRSACRGPMRIRCPYTRRDVAVRVGRAGLAEAVGIPGLRRIDECTIRQHRWFCRDACLAGLQVPSASRA